MKLGKLIIKMHTKRSKIKVASKNFHALCVVRLPLWFLYIVPMLEFVHALIKLHKVKLLCVILWNINLAGQELYWLYYDSLTKHEESIFNDFNLVEALTNESLPLS